LFLFLQFSPNLILVFLFHFVKEKQNCQLQTSENVLKRGADFHQHKCVVFYQISKIIFEIHYETTNHKSLYLSKLRFCLEKFKLQTWENDEK
jgi:hypothetical protein